MGFGASLVAQLVKNLPAMRETWVRSLGGEDPLEKGKAAHSSILAWKIPGTEELQQWQDLVTKPPPVRFTSLFHLQNYPSVYLLSTYYHPSLICLSFFLSFCVMIY